MNAVRVDSAAVLYQFGETTSAEVEASSLTGDELGVAGRRPAVEGGPTEAASVGEAPLTDASDPADRPRFTCKKCARGSSCWPVHVVTQNMASVRRKQRRRRRGPLEPHEPWAMLEGLLADGHRPTFKTYTALMTCLGDLGAPDEAEEVLARMEEEGEIPDVAAYNAVVHAWCVNERPDEAESLVRRMLAAGVKPNDATYPEIVYAYARSGQSNRVEAVISRIESDAGEESLGEKVYHAFISGCCDAGRPADAEDVLRRWNMEKYDLERVADRKGVISRPVAASYGMIIHHYVGEGRMGEARRLLSQMQWDKVVPSIEIFNMLLKGYLKADNVGAAQDVFRELEGSGTWDMESLGIKPDVASYTSLMDHWANQGDTELAENVLAKMELKGVAPDERTFGSLVKAYARARDPQGAEAVLDRMRRYEVPGGKKSGQKKKRKASGSAGKKEEKRASGPEMLRPGVVLYSTVVSAYCAVGDMSEARRVVTEMAAARVKPNERTFGHLVWGYGQLGDAAGITQTAQLMFESGISLRMGSEGRKALVRACRECGLPASHVDGLVESLTPRRGAEGAAAAARNKKGGSGATARNRWVRGDTRKKALAAAVGAADGEDARKGAGKERKGGASASVAASGNENGGNGGANGGARMSEGVGGGGWGEDRGGGNGQAGRSTRRYRRGGGPAMACHVAVAPALRQSVRVGGGVSLRSSTFLSQRGMSAPGNSLGQGSRVRVSAARRAVASRLGNLFCRA